MPGNHDYWSGAGFGPIAEAFARTGGRWMVDESVSALGGRVQIIGATGMKAPGIEPAPGRAQLLLVHDPSWLKKLGPARFDLMLAGHSHGGQVRLPFVGPLVLSFGVDEYDLGLFDTPHGPLYVNPGLGYFYMDVRWRCRPELTLLEL